jgi:hypothetical protein
VGTGGAAAGGAAAGGSPAGTGTGGQPGAPAAPGNRLPLTVGISLALLACILLAATAGFRLLGHRRTAPTAVA